MSNITATAQNLQRVLTALGWQPQADSQSLGFLVDLGAPHVPLANIYAAISVTAEQFVIYFNFGVSAVPERRDAVARFIARANWGLLIGNFELDYDDGQVRFKSSIDFSGTELSETMIRNAILPAMTAFETYANQLVAIMTGAATAAQPVK
jgi:hypothetical protein